MAERLLMGAASGFAHEGAQPFVATYAVFATRRACDFIHHEYDYRFEPGKAKLLRDGAEVLVISSGIVTMRALEVAKALEKDRIGVAVLHVPTSKPLDTQTILREAKRSGRLVVVAENHTVIGGLGEAVAAELIRAGVSCRFRQVGLPDAFLDAGALPTLHDRYGISTATMSEAIKGWLD